MITSELHFTPSLCLLYTCNRITFFNRHTQINISFCEYNFKNLSSLLVCDTSGLGTLGLLLWIRQHGCYFASRNMWKTIWMFSYGSIFEVSAMSFDVGFKMLKGLYV